MRMLTRKLGIEAGAATFDILLVSVNGLPRTTFMADILRTGNEGSVGARTQGCRMVPFLHLQWVTMDVFL